MMTCYGDHLREIGYALGKVGVAWEDVSARGGYIETRTLVAARARPPTASHDAASAAANRGERGSGSSSDAGTRWAASRTRR